MPNKMSSLLLKKIGKPVIPFSPSSPALRRACVEKDDGLESLNSPAPHKSSKAVLCSPQSPSGGLRVAADLNVPSPRSVKYTKQQLASFSSPNALQSPVCDNGLRLNSDLIASPSSRLLHKQPVVPFSPKSPVYSGGGLRIYEDPLPSPVSRKQAKAPRDDTCASPRSMPKTPQSLLQRVPLSPCQKNQTPKQPTTPGSAFKQEPASPLMIGSPSRSLAARADKRKPEEALEPLVSPKRAKLIEHLSSVIAELEASRQEVVDQSDGSCMAECGWAQVSRLQQSQATMEQQVSKLQMERQQMEHSLNGNFAQIKALRSEMSPGERSHLMLHGRQ